MTPAYIRAPGSSSLCIPFLLCCGGTGWWIRFWWSHLHELDFGQHFTMKKFAHLARSTSHMAQRGSRQARSVKFGCLVYQCPPWLCPLDCSLSLVWPLTLRRSLLTLPCWDLQRVGGMFNLVSPLDLTTTGVGTPDGFTLGIIGACKPFTMTRNSHI